MALGRLVVSKAGRDNGRKFVVVGVVNEEYVLIADGDLRKVEKPKKKKLKHLVPTEEISEALAGKLQSGSRVTNAEIRRILEHPE